ncbi:MAG: dihydrofolate reductase family protein, partial [Termitinemataceae bacterium]
SLPSRLKLDLFSVLTLLYERGIRSILVEGGSAVITSFLYNNLADRIILDITPRFIGAGTPAVKDLGVLHLAEARRFHTVSVTAWGENIIWIMDNLE